MRLRLSSAKAAAVRLDSRGAHADAISQRAWQARLKKANIQLFPSTTIWLATYEPSGMMYCSGDRARGPVKVPTRIPARSILN